MITLKNIAPITNHFLSWIAGFSIVYFAMSHSSSKEIYGIISGWWCACYFGYIASLRFKIIFPTFIAYVLICIISLIFGEAWFFHDADNKLSVHILVVILLQGCIFISPIIMNEITKMILMKIKFIE